MDLPNPITPGEAFVLLDLKHSSAIEAAKITLLSLIAQGALRIEKQSDTKACLRVGPKPPAAAQHVAALMAIVRDSEEGTVADVMRRARAQFGAKLRTYKSDLLLSALKARGLIEEVTKWILFLFPIVIFRYTPTGVAERLAIQHRMAEARRLPALLKGGAKEAAALALAAGTAIFLLPELRPLYQQISQAVQVQDPNGNSSFWEIEIDSDTLAVLGGAMHAFDAGFDVGSGGDGVDAGSGGGEGGMDME
jgi:hypothetical protein